MNNRFSAAALIIAFLLVLPIPQTAAQRRRQPRKPTTPVSEPGPQMRDVAPLHTQDLWVNIFPIGMEIFGLNRDVRDPNIIYARTHRGLYRTSNGGLYWSPVFIRGTQYLAFAQSPSSPNVMYVATRDTDIPKSDIFMPVPFGRQMLYGTIWRSDDSGRSWRDINAGLIKQGVSQVIVDPRDADVAYVLAGGALFKTLNGGRSWAVIGSGYGLFVNPWRPDELFLCERRCSESTDGGATWKHTDDEKAWTFLLFHPTNKNIRAGVAGDLFVSNDDGASWKDISIYHTNESNDSRVREEVTCLEFSLQSDQVIWAGTEYGWYVSRDLGNTWRKLRTEDRQKTGYSPTWFKARTNQPIDVAAGAGTTVYFATGLGVFKSADDGATWHQASAGLPAPLVTQDFLFGREGPLAVLAYIDDSNTIYVGPYGGYASVGGYWSSKDGGLSWEPHWIDSITERSVRAYEVAPAPISQINVTSDKTVFVTADRKIMRISPSGTSTFIQPGQSPELLSLSPADPHRLYLGTAYPGGQIAPGGWMDLTISDDGGFSWRGVDMGSHYPIPIIAVSPQSSEIAYVVGVCYGNEEDCVLLATKDGGATWRDELPSLHVAMRRLHAVGSLPRIASVVVDPKNSNVVYVTTAELVLRSEDGGINWSRLPTRLLVGPFKNLAISPSAPNELYLASEHLIFRSTDTGKTWSFSERGLTGASPQPGFGWNESIHQVMVSSNAVFAQGNNGIYRMSDDRMSWALDSWQRMENGGGIPSEKVVVESAASVEKSNEPTTEPGRKPTERAADESKEARRGFWITIDPVALDHSTLSGTQIYGLGDPVPVYIHVPKERVDAATRRPSLEIEYILLSEGKEIGKQLEDWRDTTDSSGGLAILRKIDTRALPLGTKYELQIRLRDRISGQRKSLKSAFVITQ